MDVLWIQGRTITPGDLHWIRELIAANPLWGRWQLSVHIAEHWNWRNAAGQVKDMAARTLLLKLERRGLLSLPARKRPGTANHKAYKAAHELGPQLNLCFEDQIDCPLGQLLPLRVALVDSRSQRRVFSSLLQHHHYLGYARPVGENIPYLIESSAGRPLACALFGAAAWKCAPRDRFIGWNGQQRQKHLQSVANNMRLLILPGTRVHNLASHLLAILIKRVSSDWQHKYGHPIHLLETFVERERFGGTAYRAANWIPLGQTQGRGRQGPNPRIRSTSIKDVYVFPLHHRFREYLQGLAHATEFVPQIDEICL